MLDKSTADCYTVSLCLGHMAQVRVQGVAELAASASCSRSMVRPKAARASSVKSRRRAESLVPRRAQWALIVLMKFIGHASCRLQVISGPVADAALAGRLFVRAGFQRALSDCLCQPAIGT